MVFRTYLDKFNTIIKGSDLNCGINQISSLMYGNHTTRMMIHFNVDKLRDLNERKMFPDRKKLHHVLHITNAGSLDFTQLHSEYPTAFGNTIKKRASSFDLLFFLIPQTWDNGKGYDYAVNAFNVDYFDTKNNHNASRLTSTDGSNWYKPRNGYEWKEDGIYSTDRLSTALNEFSGFSLSSVFIDSANTLSNASTKDGIILLGRQHFDIGNENINFDITDVVNAYIDDKIPNYGIGIAFTPDFENISNLTAYSAQYNSEAFLDNYVGFFTNETNTFFEPYIETKYDGYISDDRSSFAIDKNNKLYLYCTIGGNLRNLDKLPTCTIYDDFGQVISAYTNSDNANSVHQESEGVYYVNITLPHSRFKGGTMLYDTWDGITYQGNDLNAVELDFTLSEPNAYFSIGNSIQDAPSFTPVIYGIQSNEEIKRGDIRKIAVVTKKTYNTTVVQLIDDVDVRVYIKDGERELDVIPWEHTNKTINENFIVLDTSMLIPQRYYIDIRIHYGMESIIHHDMVHFKIVDDLNNKYA